MKKHFECSIIIPVFNKVEYTARCLEAVSQNTEDVEYEVIVVDNASTDSTGDLLGQLEGDIQVIRNRVNVGFARANNQAARLARGKYLVFLNNDTLPQARWLSTLVTAMEDDPGVGAVGSKLIYPEDETIQHAGVVFGPHSKVPYHIYRDFSRYHPAVNKKRAFSALTGACLAIRKELFFELGLFDEEFVNGGEDTDLCLRIRGKGDKILYIPESEVYHFEGRTPGRGDKIRSNRELLVKKWGQKIQPDDHLYYSQDGYLVEGYVPKGAQSKMEIASFEPILNVDGNWLTEKVTSILVVKPSGIGNMIMFTPALQVFRQLMPEVSITVVCYPAEAAIVREIVEKMILLESRDILTGAPNARELDDKVGPGEYDLAVYPPFTNLAGPTPHLKRVIPYHISHPQVSFEHRHEVMHNLDIVSLMGWKGEPPPMWVPVDSKAGRDLSKKTIGIHIGSSATIHMKKKRWPLHYWATLIDSLPQDYNVVFVGCEEEEDDVSRLSDLLGVRGKDSLTSFVGKLDLEQTAGVIKGCALFISNDSGLMHMASAVNTPVIGIFGPTLPSKNRPWGRPETNRVVRAELDCSPCYSKPEILFKCPEQRCLLEVTPEKVLDAANALIDSGRNDHPEGKTKARSLPRGGPTVDVLIPTFNRKELLRRAIKSMLNQTYRKWDLWVINDGGEDVSDIINAEKDPRVHLINLPHGGKSKALNAAIKASKGEFIGYLDDDDIHYDFHLEALVEALNARPDVDFVYSDTYEVSVRRDVGENRFIEVARRVENNSTITLEMILSQNHINHKNVLHRRSLLERSGLYDEGLEALVDWDMFRRMFQVCKTHRVPVLTGEHYLYFNNGDNEVSEQITGLATSNPSLFKQIRARILRKPLRLSDKAALAFADRAVRKIIEEALNNNRYQELMGKGWDLIQQASPAEALSYAQEGFLLKPDEHNAYILAGRSFFESRRFAEAEEFLGRGVQIIEGMNTNPVSPRSGLSHVASHYTMTVSLLVSTLSLQGKKGNALRILDKALEQERIPLTAEQKMVLEDQKLKLGKRKGTFSNGN